MKTLKIHPILTALFLLAAVSLQSCPDTATAENIPADWTENPLAGVVYEPIGE
ncbi:hypothetical protein [Neisseria weaveri]|uniref:hypothetical protein n=1 Tax=Neisseria weaveri TaxID=28091 RepID=UPI000A608DDC|nr:hypothetical protein [Neisseria weaveri]